MDAAKCDMEHMDLPGTLIRSGDLRSSARSKRGETTNEGMGHADVSELARFARPRNRASFALVLWLS